MDQTNVPSEETSTPWHMGRAAVVRLVLASAITLTLVPLSWVYTFMVTMLFGRPALLHVGGLVASVAAVIALSFHLGRNPAIWRRRWWLAGILFAAWTTICAVFFWSRLGDFIPKAYVLLISQPAIWCILWFCWMFFYPWRWRLRLSWLLALMLLAAPYWVFLKLEGLTGDNKLNYVWRQWQAPQYGGEPAAETPATNDVLAEVGRADYPQFLGPDRNGVLTGVSLHRDWDARPPQELWRHPVGAGWSAFAVVGNRAFTQEQRGDDECVVCYHLLSGDQIWVDTTPARFESPMGGLGPRATPTIADGRVYAVGATGILNCLDATTGSKLWTADILQGQENTYHGISGSPLVIEDQEVVLVCPAGPGGPSLVAYDVDSGEEQWRGGTHRASYSSPSLVTLHGMRQVLVHDEQGLTGHALSDGHVLWHFPWTNSVVTNASQPIAHAGAENQVFLATDYGVGAALLEISRSPNDEWTAQERWTSLAMKTKYCTAVLHDGHIYGLDEGIMACIDVAQGKRQWKGGRYGHGQLVLVGDLLLVQTESGDVVLVEPIPQELRELGRFAALRGKTWNNPALAGPFLVVRNNEEAACYELPLADE